MRVRIEDVAEAAGVSMKTVSRVLNNEPNVSKATRDRVEAAVGRLRYQPHPALFARVYGGMVFAQQLEFDDDSGDEVTRRDVDPTPIAGLTFGLRF